MPNSINQFEYELLQMFNALNYCHLVLQNTTLYFLGEYTDTDKIYSAKMATFIVLESVPQN